MKRLASFGCVLQMRYLILSKMYISIPKFRSTTHIVICNLFCRLKITTLCYSFSLVCKETDKIKIITRKKDKKRITNEILINNITVTRCKNKPLIVCFLHVSAVSCFNISVSDHSYLMRS